MALPGKRTEPLQRTPLKRSANCYLIQSYNPRCNIHHVI